MGKSNVMVASGRFQMRIFRLDKLDMGVGVYVGKLSTEDVG